jgi:hypothetical protein
LAPSVGEDKRFSAGESGVKDPKFLPTPKVDVPPEVDGGDISAVVMF